MAAIIGRDAGDRGAGAVEVQQAADSDGWTYAE
ncbi:hypothetical protein CGLO_04043 [Colletotrichum gloeosporioides Cg-14]|uniref:Uncharacterized protein n=1 Tax=Colletotrichum gloeosporioides (strain Cg-14) TaxID=1237896 RepID=T0KKA9_COLGC|nr:hypothetical protein CGLO_04043 [Colletotrichum gloeosporioides Cg-14]